MLPRARGLVPAKRFHEKREFICLQIKLTALDEQEQLTNLAKKNRESIGHSLARAFELLKEHRDLWLAEKPPTKKHWQFHRGLPEKLRIVRPDDERGAVRQQLNDPLVIGWLDLSRYDAELGNLRSRHLESAEDVTEAGLAHLVGLANLPTLPPL